MMRKLWLAGIAGAWLLGAWHANADGCFVFVWNKKKDINEPTQKAILLHDKGWEDLVLQVKYEGPAEDFGWLIPVPGLPEVRRGSMDCFYEVSRLTQKHFGAMEHNDMSASLDKSKGEDESVKVIEVKTVGAYEVTVLSATNAASLGDWLNAHHFTFPKEKQNVLDDYIKKKWYFVAAKIDPNQNEGFFVRRSPLKTGPDRTAISSSTRQKLASGELHPLIISFPSAKCVFPLAISAVNGKPSEVSLYVLSSEPLISRVIFDKKFALCSRQRADWMQKAPQEQKEREARVQRMAEMRKMRAQRGLLAMWDDPADPQPSQTIMHQLMGIDDPWLKVPAVSEDEFTGGFDLVQSMEVGSKDLPACSKEMPRLAGKTWWLTKQVEVFAPEEMRDLELEPAIPILAGKLQPTDGLAPTLYCLSQLGARAVPAVLAASKSSDPNERRLAASNMERMEDARLTAVMPGLLADADPRVRENACFAAVKNWDAGLAPRLRESLADPDGKVRIAACACLREHRDDSDIPIYRKMVEEDGLAASKAITLLDPRSFSRQEMVHFFSSTNLPVVSTAFTMLRHQDLGMKEIEPLLTNSLVMARMMGLGALTEIGDRAAVDRIVVMLRDSNEAVRWTVRARLRRLTGQKLGPDPAAWEKWWAENKDNYTPHPLTRGPQVQR